MLGIERLSPDLQKIANEELGEVPARIPEDLRVLREWIQKQPHLKARIDDQFLIQFLRGCKYSLEKSKEKLDHFYALKTNCPDLFSTTDVNCAKFRRMHNTGAYVVLPTPLNECGPRITVTRYTYSTQEFTIGEVIRHGVAVSEIMLLTDPYACINGTMFVFDFNDCATAHLMLFTPALLKKLIMFYEKTLPLRIKGVYLINLSPYAEQIMKLLLQHVPEKLRQRVFLCGKDLSSLEKHLPMKYFPREYGGENGSLDQLTIEYNQMWDKYAEYFKQNAEYGTNERLRLGKKLELDGELGCGGSFRKIAVD